MIGKIEKNLLKINWKINWIHHYKGGSFGIVTEFLVKVFPHKETKSFVAFTFIKNSYDIKNLIKAGQDGRYAINVLQPLFFRRPLASKLVWVLKIIYTYSGLKVEK